MDISPSNQCVAFGDENSVVSLYSQSTNEDPRFNWSSKESEWADHLPTFPHMSIDDPRANYASIPLPHLPPGETQYASDNWPARFAREVHRPVPPVDPAILAAMKMVGTIGYAPNIGNKKRNVMEYNLKKNADKENADGNDPNQNKERDMYKSTIPKRYKKNDIKLGKMGQDDFDFDHYNKTSFCGLEASLPNSYCNAMLQVLYFTEQLRVIILNHFCARDSCLACELSFLFHMLDTGHGIPCQPANFLRALRTIPEAAALGLIFSEASSMWRTSVPRLIQSWNRFLLQQVHLQCTDTAREGVREPSPSPCVSLAAQLASPDWSRSSPAKRTGEDKESMSKEELASMSADMADVLDQSLDRSMDKTVEEKDESPVAELLGMLQDKITRCSKCKVETSTDNLLLLCNLVYPEHATLRQTTTFGQVQAPPALAPSPPAPPPPAPAPPPPAPPAPPPSTSSSGALLLAVSGAGHPRLVRALQEVPADHPVEAAPVPPLHPLPQRRHGQPRRPRLLEHPDDADPGGARGEAGGRRPQQSRRAGAATRPEGMQVPTICACACNHILHAVV
jgi:PAB-dependent poly(A)-specific ribonuclease subunit 2